MQISLIAAMTIDGFIGRDEQDRSFNWTSAEDKKHYVQQIKKADAIVMGRKTFETFSRYPKDSHWVIYTSDKENLKKPQSKHITVETTDLAPRKLLEKLENDGKKEVMICGGSSIYTMFMQSGMVDKLYLTVEPVLFGRGIKLFSDNLGQVDLELIKVDHLSSQTIMLEYEVKK
ncbi:MAG: dihydrofolate reductase [Candidatus Pacebacteria bacterium]|nr:dihydrofolate reductase [Candidatus Paceibacterota bacterium]